jgi:hypothetical protein
MISFITHKVSGLGYQGLVDRPIPLLQACPTRRSDTVVASNAATEVHCLALLARSY